MGKQAARSGAIAIVSNAVQMVIGVSTTLVLVRILEPADFGVFAVAWILMLLGSTVRDLGVSVSIINAPSLTQERVSILFWSGQTSNLAVGLTLAILGPFLAWVYGMQELVVLMPAVGFASILAGTGAIYDGLLKRRLRFGIVAARDIGCMVAGSVTAIIVAWLGYGFWALVAQQLAVAFVGLLIYLLSTSWLPSHPIRSLAAARKEQGLLWHGSRLSVSKCISTLGMSADRLLLGTFAGERSLGLYQQAFMWSEFPVRQVYQPLVGVVVSTFSRVQNMSNAVYRSAFRQAELVLFAIALPLLIFGSTQGDLVIPVLLGDKWIDAIPLFEILCLGSIFRLVIQSCKWVYLAESRSADQLVWTLAFTPVQIAAALTGAVIGGALGIAAAMAITYAVAAPVALWYCTRRSRITVLDMILPASRPLFASVIGVAALIMVDHTIEQRLSPNVSLMVGILVFIAFNGIAWVVPGNGRHELRECIRHFSPKFAILFDSFFSSNTELRG
jgi:O-antigen/teichoic acid export membrane protein